MQVILQKTVPNLGLVGDVVEVRAGYYRNYLAPRDLAVAASAGSIKQIQHQKKVIEAKKIKEKGLAQSLKERIEGSPMSVTHAAGEGNKLYGSITSQELAQMLKAAGYEVDKRQIQIDSPIKTVGEHKISLKLHPEVVATVTVNVTRKDGENETEKTETTEEPQSA